MEAPKMSVLRRHRILADDVRRVIAHLKAHKKITANDIISRPRLKKKKGAGPTETVPWAHAPLLGSWQRPEFKSGPKGAAVLYTQEASDWKRVVPENEIMSFLRRAMLDPDSKMPHGRDSAYHHMHRITVGISRRALYKFLATQGVLQVSKNIPNEQKKGGVYVKKRGYCEIDLIEGKGIDLKDVLGFHDNWYWIALCDVLTGYGLVAKVNHKRANVVAPKLEEMLNVMDHMLGSKVYQIAADHGREFYADVQRMLKRRKIKFQQVPRGSRVEKFNQDFQRNFYRIMKMRRGTFSSLTQQAQDITNNTMNKNLRKTPEEALKMSDEQVYKLYKKGRQESKPYKGKPPKVGDKCRHLIKLRKNIRPILKIGNVGRMYKSYHARHYTKQVYRIKAIQPKPGPADQPDAEKGPPPRYFVNGKWRHRDELLMITGVDDETADQISKRPKSGVH